MHVFVRKGDGVPTMGALTMRTPSLVGRAEEPFVGSVLGHSGWPMMIYRKDSERLIVQDKELISVEESSLPT
jgi:hypothetical protein